MFKLILRFIIYKIIEFIEKIEYRNNKFDDNNSFNKIINIINNNDLLIKTDYGFVPFSEINLTSPLSLYRLELENGDWLECADYHIVFIKGHHQKFVKDLTIDDYVLCKGDYINGVKVKRITNLKSKVSMVDITVDTNERSYYSNNILSHNTISAAILI
ncbi:MAG: Hint domain-containing protein, partial [Saccharofermentanales bacterium]